MLISHKWLQSHFENEIADVETIAESLLLHSFEIEEVEKKASDEIIDIDVLPNRAHDCLSHAGIAKEIAGILGYSLKDERYKSIDDVTPSLNPVKVTISSDKCRRYSAVVMNNISVKPSPQWLRDRLTAIGQKSINNIVDATNYVMFDLGQPLHAFDADKVSGDIIIRFASENEKMTTLSNEEVILDSSDLVIADDLGILALAGVKGGDRAEVDNTTKNIILESANFDPISVRNTRRRTKIQTESSKRYENELTTETTIVALRSVVALLLELASEGTNIEISTETDIYPIKSEQCIVSIRLKKLNSVLGTSLSSTDVSNLFKRFNFTCLQKEDVFEVTIPSNRLDLLIEEDLIEEIGRWHGYHNIPSASVSNLSFSAETNKTVKIINNIKNTLIEHSFTEVMTYCFVNNGFHELVNPIASDKNFLRTVISKQLQESLDKNAKNASFFGINNISLFEIGKVYLKESEKTVCSIAVLNTDKKAKKEYGSEEDQLENIIKILEKSLSISIEYTTENNTVSFFIEDLLFSNIANEVYGDDFEKMSYESSAVFKEISVYQHSTRDISFWVEDGISSQKIKGIIIESGGALLKKVFLFDDFSKDGKTSYAFSLIFQSDSKTLQDKEIDDVMNTIYGSLKDLGCEIR